MKSFRYKGAEYRALNYFDLLDLGFDIPAWDEDYGVYFNNNDEMVISIGFLNCLETKEYEEREWHHLLSTEWGETKKIDMKNFFEKYLVK